MNELPRAQRLARGAALAFAVGLLFSVLPLPAFSFLDTSAGSLVPFPTVRSAGAAEVNRIRSALDEQDTATERVVGEDLSTPEFSMIGVELDAPPSAPVTVRVREPDGSWSEWVELEYHHDGGPDPAQPGPDASEGTATVHSSEPLWVGEATGYELSVAGEDAPDAMVSVVQSSRRRVVTEAVPLADAATQAPFDLRTRSAWNPRPSQASSSSSTLKMAVMHHTATSGDYTVAQVPRIIRSIQAYHMDINGWSDIAYNFIVDKNGTVWEGRNGSISRAAIGAHARGFNTGSVGVATIGTFTSVPPSADALEGAARVAGWRLEAYGVDPRSSANVTSLGSSSIAAGRVVRLPAVVGHQDVGYTSCPGSIESSMTSLRARSGDWYDWMRALHSPAGHSDIMSGAGGAITATGWAYDPDTSQPIQTMLVVGDRRFRALADRPRADWRANYPVLGNDHGFEIRAELPPGVHHACLVALNTGTGVDTWLECTDVTVVK